MNVFYVTTGVFTVLIAGLTYGIWKKTASLNFVFGGIALYFWSIHGGWVLTYDKTVGGEQFRYHYLESALFPLRLDEAYWASIVLFGIFCVVTLCVVFLLVDGFHNHSSRRNSSIHVSHTAILILSMSSASLGYFVIADAFVEAIVLGQTGYSAIASDSIRFFTIHQILSRLALFSSLMGFCILVSGNSSRYFQSRFRATHFFAYMLLIPALVIYMMVLGNKNELFTGFVFAMLFYVGTHHRPPIRKAMMMGAALFLIVASVDYLRNFAILSGEASEISIADLAAETGKIIFSNEAIAAHMSMYGVLKEGIEPTLGNGINALVFSVVPIDFWPDRPVGNYRYYADEIGAEAGRGYTIHHATSWYLDFGLFGVVLGGVVLGTVWAMFHNGFTRLRPGSVDLRTLFFLVAPFGFSAYMPVVIRAGVEVYKGVVIGAVAIPLFTLVVAVFFGAWYRIAAREINVHSNDN